MQEQQVTLRAARSDDLDTVFGLFAEVQAIHANAEPDFFKPPANDALFKAYFDGVLDDPQRRFTLACLGDEAIGYVQYFIGTRPETFFRAEGSVARIDHICVSKAFRRTGCGTRLIDHVKAEARRQGISLVGIDFWSFNAAARGCFEKSGFKIGHQNMWLRLQD